MKNGERALLIVMLAVVFATGFAAFASESVAENVDLTGTWRLASYRHAENGVRYQTSGYMSFTGTHWMHIAYFNRDERAMDFAEAHHGTYEVTGPDSLTLNVDIEIHTDPKKEFQDDPVFYGEAASLSGAKYSWKGNQLVINLPSSSQLVLEKLE